MTKNIYNSNGITIKQLKDFIRELPEIDDRFGDDYEVWIGSKDGSSNVCTSVFLLNFNGEGSDIILEIE